MGNTEKNRLPIYKKWWFGLICIITLSVFISGCSDSSQNNSSTESDKSSSASSTSDSSSGSSSSSDSQKEDLSSVQKTFTLSDGYYTAGVDIPAGTCNVTAVSGNGNLSSSNIFSGGINEMFGVEGDLYTKSFNGLKLPKDAVLHASSGLTVKLEFTEVTSNFTGRTYDESKAVTLSDGNYETGKAFPEGVYNIVAVSGSGNISSSNIFDGGVNEMFGVKSSGDLYTPETKNVTFKSGNTLTISGGLKVKLIPEKK